jgi:hypothetical protein
MKRWEKLAKHETFTAIMNAAMAGSAVVGVSVYFSSEFNRVMVGLLVSAIFVMFIGVYFYWDYRKTHKKRKARVVVTPLETEVVERPRPVTEINWFTITKNVFFIILMTAETVFLITFPLTTWQVFAIAGIPVLTYDNGIKIALFCFGVVLGIELLRRVRHPRELLTD